MEETKLNTIFLETQTIFRKGGDISIYPHECELGSGKEVTDEEIRYRGSISVKPDGTTSIRAYQQTGRHAFETLFCTKFTKVKLTSKQLFVDTKMPKGLGKEKIAALLAEELQQIVAYLNTSDSRLN